MPVQIEKLTDEKIIIFTLVPPLTMPADSIYVLQESSKFKHDVGGFCYRILDFSSIHLSFSDMMVGMTFEKGQDGGTYDPNAPTIVIGDEALVKFGVESLSTQEQYAGANVKGLFASREEALVRARSLEQQKK